MSSANSDLATSDALNMAHRVDPNSERTIGILTKIDIVDKGMELEIVKKINNQDFRLKFGWIGIKNRC